MKRLYSLFLALAMALGVAAPAQAHGIESSLGPASATAAGYVSTGTQSFAGDKTFLGSTSITSLVMSGDQTIGSKATPTLTKTATTTTIATDIYSSATDSGTNPIGAFVARIGASTLGTTRPLFGFYNHTSEVMSLLPLSSGANSAINWGTQVNNGPTAFATRPVGTRLILYNSWNGSSAMDNAIGTMGSGVWIGGADNNSGCSWYSGITNTMTLTGAGRLTTTGARINKVRVATTSPIAVSATTDHYVFSKLAAPGAVAFTLPAGTTGLTFIVQDATGDAASNNITITPNAGTINGAATLVINTNWGAKTLTYSGTEWLAH
jgi:hypothetical protein